VGPGQSDPTLDGPHGFDAMLKVRQAAGHCERDPDQVEPDLQRD
jgi:hypothetical protein